DTGTQMLTGFVGGLNARASSKSSITETTSAPKYNNPPTQCFVAGTQVLTPDGNVNIEEIQAGDIVIATDPETGETEEKEVVETYVNETEELIHITVDGEEIVTTPNHPFYVPEKGWTYAVELKAGDQLQLVNGEYVTVEAVQHELLEEPIKVYNFQVEDFHTYYVGTDVSVLVHNDCNKTFKSWDEMKEYYKDVESSNGKGVSNFLKDNKPKGSPNPKKWFKKGGTIEVDGSNSKTWTYTSPSNKSVTYNNGIPDFSNYLHPDKNIAEFSIGEFTNRSTTSSG
ncbi:MAG: polymorphic toxin-type HINT domain-containing protein, partial [Acutalibacteraceae bacterium]